MGHSMSIVRRQAAVCQKKIQHREPKDEVKGEPKAQDLEAFIRPLITSYADSLGYKPFEKTESDALWKAMSEYADKSGVPWEEGSHSWVCFKIGYSYAVVCMPNHPLDVQLYVGVYSWLGLLLDDEAAGALDEFQMFHKRFCAGERQPLPLLQGWADLMKLSYDHWDPVVANFIVSSSLNFLNANVLEARKEFGRIERTRGGHSWAWFLRDKDGVGEAYAWFTFPKVLCPDMAQFLEVIPDLSAWVGLSNDVLSFYKEQRVGEKHNYVHNRGWYEDKEALQVFSEIVSEVQASTKRMRLVLEGRDTCLKLLADHQVGYVAFHKLNSRYRLWEVGLGEEKTDRHVEAE